MIGFELSEEQKALVETAHKFAENEIRPVAAKFDESGEFPYEVLKKAWETGLMGENVPVDNGGMGLGCLESVLIAEELYWGCAGIATSAVCNALALGPIVIAGTPEQKEKFLRPFTESFKIASFALTEPASGSDVASMRTVYKKDGDGFLLNGSKQWITNAGYADLMTVFASADPAKGAKAISAFVVDAKAPGVIVGKKEHKLGQCASDTRAVTFENVRVPKENLLGAEGEGFKIAMKNLDKSRPGIGAAAVGLARAALEYSIQYAKERATFGKLLAEHQAIQFMIADMAKAIEASRLLCWQAAWLGDQGRPNNKESAYAKCFASDTAMQVTTDAIQIYGGYGYSKEYPVEKLFRDAKLIQIYEGANQIQRMVIAKHLLFK